MGSNDKNGARIAIVGAGAIGGFYGAKLSKAGFDVSFLARGAHLEALRDNGLTVKSVGGDYSTAVRAYGSSADIGPVDLVLFCVKAQDTVGAAKILGPLVGPNTVVLTLQNGLDSVDTLAEYVPRERLLVGTLYVVIQVVAPGVLQHAGGEGKIVFGEPGGGPSERLAPIADMFRRAEIPHETSSQMSRILWDKFLFIAGVGGVTALANVNISALLEDREGKALLTASCEEIVAVAKVEGVDLGSDPVDRALATAGKQPAHWRSSMARDLAAKRPLEVDALSGALLRKARKHGIATPVHQTIYASLTLQERAYRSA
jgi:2-dehydropantoate 2-reductase